MRPALNLLSPWVLQELRVRRFRQRFVVGAVALAVALAGAWTFQRLELEQVRADLRGEQAVTSGLTARISDLGEVRTYVEGVGRRALTVQAAMLTEVRFSSVLAALRRATPAGARIDGVQVILANGATEPGADGSAAEAARGLTGAVCPGPDPFATEVVIGCLELSGTAADREQVSRLVVALGHDPVFVEPFVSTTTTSDGSGVAFTGSVALSPAAFSGRYDDLTARTSGGAS
jgi:Tfp pilus assembly protein PilN